MLTAAAAVLLLIILLLAIPITLRFAFYSDGARPNDVSLRWAFGLVRVRLATDKPSASPVAAAVPKKVPKQRRRRRSGRRPSLIRLLTFRRLRRRLVRFARDIWRAIKKDDLSMRARVGLGDPAQTGRLWAIVGPIAGVLAGIQQASVSIEPEFAEETFEFEASGRIRIIPLQLLGLVAALALSPTLWWAMWRARAAQ